MLGLAVMLVTVITNSTAIPFALSYVVIMSGELSRVYGRLCSTILKQIPPPQQQKYEESRRELKLGFKLLKKFVGCFEKSARRYSALIVTDNVVSWLQLLAVATTAGEQIGLTYIYFSFSKVLSLALLMYAGIWVKKEVSQ